MTRDEWMWMDASVALVAAAVAAMRRTEEAPAPLPVRSPQ